eukprot:gene10807-16956_t
MAFSIQKLSSKSGVARAQAPKRSIVVSAAARDSWAPGAKALAGDFGFDPLNLGADPEALKWYVQAELVHGRTAMTAVAGILIPGLLTKAGVADIPDWTKAGEVYNASEGAIPFNTLVIVQVLMVQFVELKRWEDLKNPGSQGEPGSFLGLEGSLKGTGQNGYPGGLFDPMGMASGSKASLDDLKLKEIKNGRLAMLAFIGFAAQSVATGKGPIDNWFEHVASPWTTTFASNGASVPFF